MCPQMEKWPAELFGTEVGWLHRSIFPRSENKIQRFSLRRNWKSNKITHRMPEYVIGIDLGTTNSALAYAAAASSNGDRPDVRLFAIPQLVNPGEVAELDLLPSALYIPGEGEFVEGALALPWNERPAYITGRLAQMRGVE